MAPQQFDVRRIFDVINRQQAKLNEQDNLLQQVLGLLKSSADTPKFIEDKPGRRVPYVAPIDLTIPASSTSRVEGTFNFGSDGPFVCIAVAGFYRRTSGAYQGVWGTISALDARIASAGQQHGYGYLFDQPHIISGDFEIIDRASNRQWQDRAISSALFSQPAGGVFVLSMANVFQVASSVSVAFTPGVAPIVAGVVQFLLIGYKIIQGDTFQP